MKALPHKVESPNSRSKLLQRSRIFPSRPLPFHQIDHGLAIVHHELPVDVSRMSLYRPFGDEQSLASSLGTVAARQIVQHINLAIGQAFPCANGFAGRAAAVGGIRDSMRRHGLGKKQRQHIAPAKTHQEKKEHGQSGHLRNQNDNGRPTCCRAAHGDERHGAEDVGDDLLNYGSPAEQNPECLNRGEAILIRKEQNANAEQEQHAAGVDGSVGGRLRG